MSDIMSNFNINNRPNMLRTPQYGTRFMPGQFYLPHKSIFLENSHGRSNYLYNNPFLANIDTRTNFQKTMDAIWQVTETAGFATGVVSDILSMFGFGKDNNQA